MVRLILIIFILVSCNSRNITFLKESKTIITSDSLFFQANYRNIKEVCLPTGINSNSLYVESYYLFGPKKKKFKRTDLFNGIYRFYNNGAFNDFSMPQKNNLMLSKYYNPNHRGGRGICFKESGKNYIDLLGKSSEFNTIGIYRYEIIFISNDTLKLKRILKNDETIYVFSRKTIENDTILNYKSDW